MPAKELRANYKSTNAAKAVDGKRTEYRITDTPGLILRCEPSGKAVWYFQYGKRLSGSFKLRKMRLGSRDTVSLADARERASELHRAVEMGGDPVLEQKTRKEGMTFAAMAEAFLTSGKLSANSQENYGEALRKHAFPVFGDMPAETVTPEHIVAMCHKIEKAGALTQSDRVKAYVGGVYRWGIGERYVADNPTKGLVRRAAKSVRTRTPTAKEIVELWHGPERAGVMMSAAMRDVLRLAILTGQRRAEVCEARVAEFDLEVATWTIPGDIVKRGKVIRGRTKNGREQIVRLSTWSVEIARQCIERHANDIYVFPAKRGANPTSIQPHSVSTAIRRMRQAIGLEDITAHDLRRAIGNWMKDAGYGREVRDIVLNHVDSSVDGVHYSSTAMMEKQVREAMQAWGDHVAEIVGLS